MKKAIQIALASFVITAGLIKAAPAIAAQPVGEIATSIVRTADLDLGSDSGRRQLDARLAIAAREVCGAPSAVDLEGSNEARKCREAAIAKARAEANAVLAATGNAPTIAVTASR